MLHRPVNHQRKIEQRDRIEQGEHPVGAYRRMHGEEEQGGNEAASQALHTEKKHIPYPYHLALPVSPPAYQAGKHQKNHGARHRAEWKTRRSFLLLYIHRQGFLQDEGHYGVSPMDGGIPCRLQHDEGSEHLMTVVNRLVGLRPEAKVDAQFIP